jgi:hypothetical protein
LAKPFADLIANRTAMRVVEHDSGSVTLQHWLALDGSNVIQYGQSLESVNLPVRLAAW